MKLYVVVRCGVYRHNIPGIFTSQELDINMALMECRREEDDYHTYDILMFEADKIEETGDGERVCEIRRSDGTRYKTDRLDNTRWIRTYFNDGRWEEYEL